MIDDQKFASVLLERSLLTEAKIRQLAALASSRHTSLYRAAVESRALEEETGVRIAAKLLGVKAVSLKGFSAAPELTKLYPQAMMEQHRFVPISLEQGRLFVAMEDPTDAEALRLAGEFWNGIVSTILVGPLDLAEVFHRMRSGGSAPTPQPREEAAAFRFAEPPGTMKQPMQAAPALGASLLTRGDAERIQRESASPARRVPLEVALPEEDGEIEATAFPDREPSVPDPFGTEALPSRQVSSPFLLSLGDGASSSQAEIAAREVRQASSDALVRALVRALLARGLVTEAELAEQLHRKK